MAVSINTGIGDNARREIAEGLSRVLADSYTLYLKTHNFHWNVTGELFNTLHLMFETQYTELATAVDTLAERIRALGAPAPGTYADFTRLSSVKETEGVPPAREMVTQLVNDHETTVRTMREVYAKAEAAGDHVTSGMLATRMEQHEKTAWMLRSMVA